MVGARSVHNQRREKSRIGRYEVVRKLAEGGMAEVFLARTEGLHGFERLFAIKRLRPEFTEDPEFVQMFIDEARIATRLTHRNIVQTFDVGEDMGIPFMAMEYVNGLTLYELYLKMKEKRRWISTSLATYLISEVAKGLHFAHTVTSDLGEPMGIVHRDVSPQNVLISFQGDVKVADFGIALAKERLQHTRPGVIKGKCAYTAPERLVSETTDQRADVFALGVLFYELLTRKNPFAAENPIATLKRVVEEQVDPPSAQNGPQDAVLDRICIKALEKDPNDRFESTEAFAAQLREYVLSSTGWRQDAAAGDMALRGFFRQLIPEYMTAMASPACGGENDPTVFSLHPQQATLVPPADAQPTLFDPRQGIRPNVLSGATKPSRQESPTVASVTANATKRIAPAPHPWRSGRAVQPQASLTERDRLIRFVHSRRWLIGLGAALLGLGLFLTLRPAKSHLLIETVPDKSEVWLENERLGTTPLQVTLDADKTIAFRVVKKGYDLEPVSVRMNPNENRTLRLRLQPMHGSLTIVPSPPLSEVKVNGESLGRGKIFVPDLPVGAPIRVRVSMEGYRSVEQIVELTATARELRVPIRLRQSSE
jgi:serine/threonine protein kinase